MLTDHTSYVRFTYDGQRITDDDTPNTLDMEENGMHLLIAISLLLHVHLMTHNVLFCPE
jgi:hypothetical protein